MTIGTRGPLGLEPGKSIEISYDLIAPDPSPQNEKVVAPLRAEFSAERFGPVCGRDCPMHRQSRSFTTEEISLLESKQYH